VEREWAERNADSESKGGEEEVEVEVGDGLKT